MTRNEELYPDADTFKPERFFNKSGELNLDDRVLAYGFGRR
jgi:cytochrome P450